MVKVSERFHAEGHPNIRALHPTTLEITRESTLRLEGDCIIGVGAEKAARDLSEEVKKFLKRDESNVILTLQAGELEDVIEGHGQHALILENPVSMVFRKSTYICGRTVMVRGNKAAMNLDRRLIKRLKDMSAKLDVTIEVSI